MRPYHSPWDHWPQLLRIKSDLQLHVKHTSTPTHSLSSSHNGLSMGASIPSQSPQSSCLTTFLATTMIEVPAQQSASPSGHHRGGFYNSWDERSQGSELRKGQEQKRPMSSPVTCDFRYPNWSVSPKPHIHIVEPRLKHAGRQMKVWAMMNNARSTMLSAHLLILMGLILACADRSAVKGLGKFPKVWEYNPTSQGQDLP